MESLIHKHIKSSYYLLRKRQKIHKKNVQRKFIEEENEMVN